MNPKLEETIVLDFTTHSPTTGGVSDADSTPSVDVFEDTTDTAILTPTPVKRTGKTGNYRVSVACTAANGFEAGKSYNVVASATVGGVTGKGVVGSIQVRARSTDDVLPTSSYTAPPSAASIRSEIDANSTKLDVAVGTRLATAGYTTPPTVAAIRSEIDTNSTKLDVTVGSRLSTAGYTAPNNAGISSILTAVDTEVAAILAAVDTEVAAIKAKTDALPADTNATLTALTALVDDLEGRLTAVRAGLLDNLTNLDALISSRQASGGIRKSQAFGNFKFAMISTTTGEGLPGLTVTAQRVLGSGSLEACANSPVEISAGFYRINFASADLSDDCCGFLLTAPGARPVFITLVTQP